jgi:hypothetical protein
LYKIGIDIFSDLGKSGHTAQDIEKRLIFIRGLDNAQATRVARWFIFKPKNSNLGNFWSASDWKILAYFMAIWNFLRTFGILYGYLVHMYCVHLVRFFLFWYHVARKIWQPCKKRFQNEFLSTHGHLGNPIEILEAPCLNELDLHKATKRMKNSCLNS